MPDSLHPKFYQGPQMAEFGWIFNSTLTYLDFSGGLHPMLARDIPTRENGDWVVNPDGTMVTTYRLRSDIRWHDGQPISSQDFVFAFTVYADPETLVTTRSPEDLISSVTAVDEQTFSVLWKQPYVRANMLGYQALDPLPRHLLEAKYRASPSEFSLGDEFKGSYVGSGPYRVERYEAGSHIVARANRDWFLGVPKIDVVDIRFIPDNNTLMANLLSGEIQLTSSPSVRGSEAALWKEQRVADGRGYIRLWETMLRYTWFQFREVPNWQRDVADIRVRRAMMHAIDRQSLVEALNFGLGHAADAFFLPSDAAFPQVDRAITKYPYDPTRASALLAEAGWRRDPGSDLLVDTSGRTLDLDPWRSAGTGAEQEVSASAPCTTSPK